ncbi:MotE family protein [Anaerobacillus sp. CMMVII]|uniref:MotE family protein n=1 Tax=Anaerobacillus sp. CMMVII TaxID=2755588 RepID=UPI0021B77A0B|nr:MotE family protein [Anaerobacillus sp. CMMVII]MCT8139823.1 MotE family protein [Anaerobacillus sp. CMMVII]
MKKEEQEYSKTQWFVMVIFIPTVFALLLFGVILSVIGVNLVDHTKQIAANIPIFSEFVKTDEQILEEELQKNINDLASIVDVQEKEIDQLKQSITQKEGEIVNLLAEIKLLMKKLDEKQEAQVSIKKEYEDLAKMYLAMSANNAARILSELPVEEAATQLSFIKIDTRASILAKMSPEKAAELITLLSVN